MAKKSEDQKDISATNVAGAASEKTATESKAGSRASGGVGRSSRAKSTAGSVASEKMDAPPLAADTEALPGAINKPPANAAEDVGSPSGSVDRVHLAGAAEPVSNDGPSAGGETRVEDSPVGEANVEGEAGAGGGFNRASCGTACEWLRSFTGGGCFCAALSFLTRLGPAREHTREELGASMLFFPLVGILLGLLALIPVWLIPAGYFWLKAWAFVAVMVWLTRGLHWDGLADLADALGSNRSGEAFQEVLKDSRSGVFAILAVVFCAIGYIFAAQSLLLGETWLPFVLAPAFARCAPLYIANLSRPYATSSLGKLMEQGVDLKIAVAWTAGLALVAVLAGYVLAAVLSLVASAAVLYYLLNLAQRHEGYNGDFMGAGVVLVELGTLLAFALG